MQPLGTDVRWANRDKRCLLIDAMGTLISLIAPAPLLRTELARRFGVEVTLGQAQRAIRAEVSYYRAHMNEGRDVASVRGLHARCAQALGAALPASLNGVDGDALTEALLASLQFSVFDDAPRALRAARSRGWRVVVVSNWDASLSRVLDRVGLGPAIDRVVSSAGAGASKPEAAIFGSALALAGCTASQALHVGDSLHEDVDGARAVGIDAVWLDRAGAPAPADVPTIATLDDLGL
jgi:putative hydrolase of the HAD superfamily